MDKTERKRTDIFRIMDENMLESSKKDVRSKAFFFPKRILWMKGQVQNSQALLEEREIQINAAFFEGMERFFDIISKKSPVAGICKEKREPSF